MERILLCTRQLSSCQFSYLDGDFVKCKSAYCPEAIEKKVPVQKISEKVTCKGRFFRADSHIFRTKRGIGINSRLNELKKISCKGCPDCNWVDDVLNNKHESILGMDSLEHGKIYTIKYFEGLKETDYSYLLIPCDNDEFNKKET